MNKDPEYYRNLVDRYHQKIDSLYSSLGTLEEMLYNVEQGKDPWPDEEEYNDIMEFMEIK